MSDESVIESEGEAREPDPFLGTFVRLANEGDASFAVTLWIGGAIVSGTLVGIDEHFDALATDLDDAGLEPVGDTFRRVATEMRDERDMRKAARQAVGVDGLGNDPIHFIHLRDARTYAPGGHPIPANRGVAWRGRLDAVDAWCFGLLSAD